MSTFLFDEIIFGPVKSRRLGRSLGVNLLPTREKVCNFNCVYCECGLTKFKREQKLPRYEIIIEKLEHKLQNMVENHYLPDSITFAGNGEPTLHPEFKAIIEQTILLRDKYCKTAKVTVLTNATTLNKREVTEALDLVDQNVLKLDSAIEETVKAINCPVGQFNLNDFITAAKAFKNKPLIQTLFFRGTYNNIHIDNTRKNEIAHWLKVLKDIRPASVMIYTIARHTAVNNLEKVSEAELHIISETVKSLGIPVLISA